MFALTSLSPALDAILERLPDCRVIELWPDHILLENTAFTKR